MKSVCSSQRSRISRKWQTKWQSFSGRLSTGKQTETGKWRVESGEWEGGGSWMLRTPFPQIGILRKSGKVSSRKSQCALGVKLYTNLQER